MTIQYELRDKIQLRVRCGYGSEYSSSIGRTDDIYRWIKLAIDTLNKDDNFLGKDYSYIDGYLKALQDVKGLLV